MLNVIGSIEIMLVLVMDENVSLFGNCVCVCVCGFIAKYMIIVWCNVMWQKWVSEVGEG